MKKLLGLGYMFALVLTVACGSTDAGITTSVKAKLAADDAVKAYQVDVDTHEHVVTLTGTVDNELAKTRALMLAREADGVRDVVDNISVNDSVATSGRDFGDAAADKISEGADATANGTKKAAHATANAVDKAEDKTEEAAKDAGHAISDSAKKVGTATKKGAEAVVDGAKKVGSEVKHAVTDDDHDSDKDGK